MSDSIRLNVSSTLCEVCQSAQGKYRCPGCQMVTCSLPCSKQHKKDNDCSGKEDKTKFVEKKNFQSIMSSDFRLIENLENSLDRMGRSNRGFGQFNHVPRFMQILIREAKKRGTRLMSMSNVFMRHKHNKSFYVISSKLIQWTVEWVFDFGDHKEKFYQHKVLESSTIVEALRALFNESNSKLWMVKDFKRSQDCDLKVLFYHVKNERGLASRFSQTDLSAELKEALAGKTVVEFPTFYVIFKKNWSKYSVTKDVEEFMSTDQSSLMGDNLKILPDNKE